MYRIRVKDKAGPRILSLFENILITAIKDNIEVIMIKNQANANSSLLAVKAT